MPRDGLQQYAPPPGTQGVANYTIESARYNTFVADITADQNNPRPIVAGGTGANNAYDAMIALKGEIANQGPVTNYDSFPFVSGSFFSNVGATASPDGASPATHYFKGICYGIAGNSLTLDCQEVTDETLALPKRYTRSMYDGTWGPWRQRTGTQASLLS